MNLDRIISMAGVAVMAAVIVVALLAGIGWLNIGGPSKEIGTPTQFTPEGQKPSQVGPTNEIGDENNKRQFTTAGGSLLPAWGAVYNGSCSDCHMGTGSLHDSPFHPVGLNKQDTANWFFDDDKQAGPNVKMSANQPSGISIRGKKAYCGDCHTATSSGGFNPDKSAQTADPHSVHEDVTNREGCDRCHGNEAAADTNGVTSPINMVRQWDGDFLATTSEAPFRASGVQNGWARYLSAQSNVVVEGSCGDCHGRYHEGTMDFTFSVKSRVGPTTNVTGGIGIMAGESELACEDCHVSDVHAVHTNGEIMLGLEQTEVSGLKGAESCLECHGVGVAESEGGHFIPNASRKLGLIGPRDVEPDAVGYNQTGGDCGFCHEQQP